MLSGAIQQFERIANDLMFAVRLGDEDEVHIIDARLQTLVHHIFNLHVQSRSEISAQIDFFHRLAVRNYEDGSSVRRYTDMMIALFDRYMEPTGDLKPAPPGLTQGPTSEGYDPSLSELVLDSVPERVLAVGLDYRYIYCNKHNADFHAKRPFEFVGKHLLDFLDLERFQCRVKPRLDQCFSGARVSYKYEVRDRCDRMFEVDCCMSPLAGPDKTIAGAVVVLVMQPMFARLS